MERYFTFHVRGSEGELREWLSTAELPDFSLLISRMPEEQFTLKRRGYFVEDGESEGGYFAIDAEMRTYEEVDGQWEPQFELLRQCVRLRIQSGESEQLVIEGEVNAPRGVRESIQQHLESIRENISRALEESEDSPHS